MLAAVHLLSLWEHFFSAIKQHIYGKPPKTIEPHNPEWLKEFEELKKVFLQHLPQPIQIHHVGSTSIPEVYAKAILDIDIAVEEKEQLPTITKKLKQLGYIFVGERGVPGRFTFRQISSFAPYTPNAKKWLKQHLYVCYADSLALKNHLSFKKQLLEDDTKRYAYNTLKLSLTQGLAIEDESYTVKKTDFILDILKKAGFTAEELQSIKAHNLSQ